MVAVLRNILRNPSIVVEFGFVAVCLAIAGVAWTLQ